MKRPVQLSLSVSLRDDATFDNFYLIGDVNKLAHQALQNQIETLASQQSSNNILLWGAHASGLSHLLQASCHRASAKQLNVQFLPLGLLREQLPQGMDPAPLLDGLECCDLLCLDGLELIAGNESWESAIFHLYNKLKDAGRAMVFSSHQSANELAIALPDLRSRILGSEVYRIEELDDDGKAEILRKRAHARGMELPPEVVKYISLRSSRDLGALFQILDKLDAASLQQKRKPSIPLAREILQGE
jgi:DnaA family protein